MIWLLIPILIATPPTPLAMTMIIFCRLQPSGGKKLAAAFGLLNGGVLLLAMASVGLASRIGWRAAFSTVAIPRASFIPALTLSGRAHPHHRLR